MYFEHIHSFPSSSTGTSLPHTTLCSLFQLLSSIYTAHIFLDAWPSNWSMIGLPVSIILKKTDSPLRSYQLPVYRPLRLSLFFFFFRSHKLTWIYVAPAVPRFIEIFLPPSAGITGVYYHKVIHTWFYYSLHSEFPHALPWPDSFSWIDIVPLCIWPRIYPFFY